MAKRATKKSEINEAEETLEEASLESIQEESETLLAEMDVDETPLMTDPEWSNYVLSQFESNETDGEGSPLVHGLRRVARKLLGDIVLNDPVVVQSPVYNVDGLPSGPAVAKHTLKILWERDTDEPYFVEFSEVADVHYKNADPAYARFATALAATRAESRNLRKALQLNKCSAEEKTTLPAFSDDVNGEISGGQKTTISLMCGRMGIDVKKFINSGTGTYGDLDDVPYGKADKMCEILNEYQQKAREIPAGIKK